MNNPSPNKKNLIITRKMVLLVRACATPQPEAPKGFTLPKRVQRVRRVVESKRLETFKEIHEALKKTAKDEHAFIMDFFNKSRDMFKEDEDEEKDEDTE